MNARMRHLPLHLFVTIAINSMVIHAALAKAGVNYPALAADTLELYFFETLCAGQLIAGLNPRQDTALQLFCPGNNGAPDTLKTIEVDIIPAPAFRILGDSILCPGDTARLEVEGFFTSYRWSTGEATRSITALAPGQYAVTVTSSNGCQGGQSLELQESAPEAMLDIEQPSCPGINDGIISAYRFFGGAAPYELSFNGGPFTRDTVFAGLSPGAYGLLWRDAGGCTDSIFITLEEPPPFNVEIGPDTTLWPGDSLHLSATVSGPVERWAWSPPHLFDCDSCAAPRLARLENTAISLLVQNAAGCTATDSKQLDYREELHLYVPNAFAPYNGRSNPTLRVFPGPGNWHVASFEVYNRWGGLWYRAEGPVRYPSFLEWDGRVKGELAPPGLCLWVAELALPNGTKRIRSGNISVIR